MKGYKGFTHDLYSPVTFEGPMFGGSLPAFVLEKTEIDNSILFWKTLPAAICSCGLWPSDRPARFFRVRADGIHHKGSTFRTESLVVREEVRDAEMDQAISEISKRFGRFQKQLAASQIEWRAALNAPYRDSDKVGECLAEALDARNLQWEIREFPTAEAVHNAFDNYAALQNWHLAEAGFPVGKSYRRRDEIGKAFHLWKGRDADSDVTAALMFELYSLLEKIHWPPETLTVGIRKAFEYGLDSVVPLGEGALGYSMLP